MSSVTARLLIADTVGLGKTVEAGLIMAELLARGRARSVLIVTPANLREQWRQQMRDLFYQEFEIISSETRKRLERAIPPGAEGTIYAATRAAREACLVDQDRYTEEQLTYHYQRETGRQRLIDRLNGAAP